MTNAEKFLKDNASIEELCCDFIKFCNNRKRILTEENELENLNEGGKLGIFLQQNIKPTLTKDERVILSNTSKEYKYIYRDEMGKLALYISSHKMGATRVYHSFQPFENLFQFIKERRRILNKGVVRKWLTQENI